MTYLPGRFGRDHTRPAGDEWETYSENPTGAIELGGARFRGLLCKRLATGLLHYIVVRMEPENTKEQPRYKVVWESNAGAGNGSMRAYMHGRLEVTWLLRQGSGSASDCVIIDGFASFPYPANAPALSARQATALERLMAFLGM